MFVVIPFQNQPQGTVGWDKFLNAWVNVDIKTGKRHGDVFIPPTAVCLNGRKHTVVDAEVMCLGDHLIMHKATENWPMHQLRNGWWWGPMKAWATVDAALFDWLHSLFPTRFSVTWHCWVLTVKPTDERSLNEIYWERRLKEEKVGVRSRWIKLIDGVNIWYHLEDATYNLQIFGVPETQGTFDNLPDAEAKAKRIAHTYTIMVEMYADNWSASFSFEAADYADAQKKRYAWARHQGYCQREVRIRIATPIERKNGIHNEHMSGWGK